MMDSPTSERVLRRIEAHLHEKCTLKGELIARFFALYRQAVAQQGRGVDLEEVRRELAELGTAAQMLATYLKEPYLGRYLDPDPPDPRGDAATGPRTGEVYPVPDPGGIDLWFGE